MIEEKDKSLEENEAGLSSPVSVPGMGEPSLPSRDSDGSGDVPMGSAKRKRKRTTTKKVKNYDDFLGGINPGV